MSDNIKLKLVENRHKVTGILQNNPNECFIHDTGLTAELVFKLVLERVTGRSPSNHNLNTLYSMAKSKSRGTAYESVVMCFSGCRQVLYWDYVQYRYSTCSKQKVIDKYIDLREAVDNAIKEYISVFNLNRQNSGGTI